MAIKCTARQPKRARKDTVDKLKGSEPEDASIPALVGLKNMLTSATTNSGKDVELPRSEDLKVEPFCYGLSNLRPGRLVKRYKRFLADVLVDEEEEPIVVHCPNTGPMTGLLDRPLAPVLLSTSSNAKRKYAHTLELVQSEEDGPHVGVHSASANAIVSALLASGVLKHVLPYHSVRREVLYGADKKSRVDFVLESEEGKPLYVEVKSVTLAEDLPDRAGRIAMFPDTVSTRAQRHMQELIQLVEMGHKAATVYLIQRGDCDVFAPCHAKDPVYGRLVLEAAAAGVQILPMCCTWVPSACKTEATLQYRGLATLNLEHGLQ